MAIIGVSLENPSISIKTLPNWSREKLQLSQGEIRGTSGQRLFWTAMQAVYSILELVFCHKSKGVFGTFLSPLTAF